MSFWVDPPGLILFGALVCVLHVSFNTSKAMLYSFSGRVVASFAFGGLGLVGYGLAKKNRLGMKGIPVLIIGIVRLSAPSVIESLLPH